MRVFIGILAVIALLVLGLFVAALIVPEAEEEKKPGLIESSSFFPAGPDAAPVAPITQAMLSPEKQLHIWSVEHLSFVVERRFASAFCPALAKNGKSRRASLKKLFHNDATVNMPTWGEWQEQTVAPLTVRHRQAKDGHATSSTAELIEWLVAEVKEFKNFQSSQIVVNTLAPEDKGQWTADLTLLLYGLDESGAKLESSSRHTVGFRIENELKSDAEASVASWKVEEVTRRVGVPPFASVTKEVGFKRTQISDNWTSKGTVTHRFQISVDDFDNDGDPDVSVAGRDRKRVVYKWDDGEFVYALKSLSVPQKYSSELPGNSTLWFDYDNDGFMDLLSGPNLMHSEGGRKLVDVTRDVGIYTADIPNGVITADYDCDGDLDLYFVNTLRTGVEQTGSWVKDPEIGLENELWQNQGNGLFKDVTSKANADCGTRQSQSATWFYFDNDHYPDLFVANDTAPPTVLRNKGDGTFEDVSESLGLSDKVLASTGVCAGDFDNDGHIDVYLSNIYSRSGLRILAALESGDFRDDAYERLQSLADGSRLYRSNGNGGFEDVAKAQGVNGAGWSWGATMFDLNSDGWLDIYSTCGLLSKEPGKPDAETCIWRSIATHPIDRGRSFPPIGPLDQQKGEFWTVNTLMAMRMSKNIGGFQQNQLYLSNKGQGFLSAASVSGADVIADSRSATPADIDSDGDLDLIVASAGGGPLRVFRNTVAQGHRVDVRLRGTKSNRFGIGCRLTAEFAERRIVRDLFTSTGFMSNGPSMVWLGLGTAEKIDRLTVRWPTGETQEFTDVKADRRIQITEESDEIKTLLEFKDQVTAD